MTKKPFGPRMNTNAFRVWQYCEPLGWDVTIAGICEALDMKPNVVGRVLRAKGWTTRVRTTTLDSDIGVYYK